MSWEFTSGLANDAKIPEQIKPNVSDVWRTDELYMKVKGNNKYLFALMDDETRFWIAQQVADKKNSTTLGHYSKVFLAI
jgi:transposase-like protein